MAQKLIPWNTGGGNIIVNYSGSGNDTVTVGSDTNNNSINTRSQVLIVKTTEGGTVTKTITVQQISLYETALTFRILSSGSITWKCNNASISKTIQYKKNGGSWTNITSSTSGVSVSVNTGDMVQFRGDNSAYGNSSYYNYFSTTCKFNAEGNIMSLFSKTNFKSVTSFSAEYALRNLFYTSLLVDASNLVLPAASLTNGCYRYFFSGCGELIVPPALPATTMADACYYGMFQSCTRLEEAPALPALNLAYDCYGEIFSGCTSLTVAPALQATTLATYCYLGMFYGCTALETAPVLPASATQSYSYYRMFYGCSNLKYIKCLATSLAGMSAYQWVQGVASSGTFVKHTNMSSWSTGVSGIPREWTVQNATS